MQSRKKYQVPSEHYFRLHHIRPRFKSNMEGVLLNISTAIAEMPVQKKEDFDLKMNILIKAFPGNAIRTPKTINNWRTEISSLFGFVLYHPETKTEEPSIMAKSLAEKQDLVEFFKKFCYTFQYPGGHLKSHETKKIIEKKIRFKPVNYILKLLYEANKEGSESFGINKAEATHCIFNDLRVTSQSRPVEETLKIVKSNREQKIGYEWKGDVIRYAGDILDYMYWANLLKKYGEYYYLNPAEMEAIAFFIQHEKWFSGYDQFYKKSFDIPSLQEIQNEWFFYVSDTVSKISFATDVFSFLNIDKEKYKLLEKAAIAKAISEFKSKIESGVLKTKEIGDVGTGLAHGHECMRLKLGKREDLIGKVVVIPDKYKIGYDIKSYELNSELRLIEVKSTVSNTSVGFNTFHMTENEWNTAGSLKEKYYVYRILITRADVKLFIIRDPVRLYKKGVINVVLHDGAQVNFPKRAGREEKLLIWQE